MMRIALILALCCSALSGEPLMNFGRTWNPAVERGKRLEFTIEYGMGVGAHGRGHEQLFSLVDAFRSFDSELKEKLNTSYVGPVPPVSIVVDTLRAMKVLDNLRNYPDAGLRSEYHSLWRATLRDTLFKGDAITVSASSSTVGGITSRLDVASLFGRRLLEDYGSAWLQDIDPLIQALMGKQPSTAAGRGFAGDLVSYGYDVPTAEVMAWLAEKSGISFGGLSGAVLRDVLNNSLNGYGDSLELGDSPLDTNESKLIRRVAVIQRFGFGYSASIGGWATVGAQVNYIRASIAGNERYVRDTHTANGVAWPLIEGVGDAMSWRLDDLRQVVSVDLGLLFTPKNAYFDKLSIGLQVHDVNSPKLRWKDGEVHCAMQARISCTWDLFGKDLPFIFRADCDLNSVESAVLPNYHLQTFRWEFGVEPDYDKFGLSVKLGSRWNIAEPGEPNVFMFELGLHFWAFELHVGGEATVSTISFSGVELPSQFGAYARVRLRLDW